MKRGRVVMWVMLCTGCGIAPSGVQGPIPVRSQHPANLGVLHLTPQTVTIPTGRVELRWTNAYSNLFLAGSNPATGDLFEMDGELWRSAVGGRFGLGAGFDLDFQLAAAHSTGGFLDGFISDWHDLFHFPDQGRPLTPENRFVVRAEAAGSTVFDLAEDSFEWLDLPLALSWTAVEPSEGQPFGLALRGGVELPVGDQHRGFGNGGLDFAFGLVGEYRAATWDLTGHLEHTFAANPERAAQNGFEFGDVTAAGLAVELPVTLDWSAVLQLEYDRSTLRNLRFDRAADDQTVLWAAARAALGDDAYLEFGLGEDLATYIAPDFTLWIAIRFGLGGTP